VKPERADFTKVTRSISGSGERVGDLLRRP
jgi:hypothetical protein